MNLLRSEISSGEKRIAAKASLNPNAVEFVPLALRSPSTGISSSESASSKFAAPAVSTNGKALLDRSESSVSNNSDDESHRYWRHQLPDDITPDFQFMTEDYAQGINSLPLSGLSLTDVSDGSKYVSPKASNFMSKDQGLSPLPVNGNQYGEQQRNPVSSFGEYPSFTEFQPSAVGKSWSRQIVGNDHLLARGSQSYSESMRNSYPLDISDDQQFSGDNTVSSSLEFLASQFPGFAVDSLAGVYFASGGDMNVTIDMLTQLEHQFDGTVNQNLDSKTLSSPTLSALDFPALSSASDGQGGLAGFPGDDLHLSPSSYRSSGAETGALFRSNPSMPSRIATDFASAVRKMASRDAGIWKYDRNGSPDADIGSSRSSQILASSYNGGGLARSSPVDRLPNSSRASPVWLETGTAVANMYSEMREEARDHARVRNAYFEQARQAYLIGNKALAKELSIKGQLHNIHMKAAHGKAQDSIYRHRNPEMHSSGGGGGRERLIDLHGLHVSEALHVLKRELAVMRNAARAADQRLLVDICVGTGHHTRGSRTPARLPAAVQRYLLEEEGLHFSEPQPGLLRVVMF
ncbi:hypothetical protein M569_09253 [Genlisea aurea]|uniref:Smr domain-containing protein n=1 Tax=Genlisea aurea TaxID=192259 RepID=S8CF28_9LAMI|nr:hypothetical protein M569_09253 [Genlisea aurea]